MNNTRNKSIKLFALVLASTITHLSADNPAEFYLETAQEQLAKKDYKAANESLKKVLEKTDDPQLIAKVKNAIGWAYYSDGKIELAKEYLDAAYTLSDKISEPKISARALNNLALVEFSQGNYNNARQHFSNKLVVNQSIAQKYLPIIEEQQTVQQSNQHIASGKKHRINQQFSQAIDEYDQALKLTPDSGKILDYKGYALFRLQRYDEAIRVLNYAFSLKQTGNYIPLNLVKAYCGSGKIETAVRFIQTNPNEFSNKQYLKDGELLNTCPATVITQIKSSPRENRIGHN